MWVCGCMERDSKRDTKRKVRNERELKESERDCERMSKLRDEGVRHGRGNEERRGGEIGPRR